MYTQKSCTIVDTEEKTTNIWDAYGRPKWLETRYVYKADGDPMLIGKDMNFPFIIKKAFVFFEQDINPKEIRRDEQSVRIWVDTREMNMLYTNPREFINALFPDMNKPCWS